MYASLASLPFIYYYTTWFNIEATHSFNTLCYNEGYIKNAKQS